MMGAFLLLILSLYWQPVNRIMKNRVFQYLGKYSMAIYMIHYPILISASSWIYYSLASHYEYNFAVFITFGLTIIIILLTAPIFQRIIGFLNKGLEKVYARGASRLVPP